VSRTNRFLAVGATLFFVLSLLSYRQSVDRADRFERGQKLLPNLNPDEVATIVVSQGEEQVTLRREDEVYTIVEAQGYLARNDAVNRLLRDLLELGLEKEIGQGESLEAELEIEPPGESTVEVRLLNASEQEMVRLRIGASSAEGPGHYIKRLDEEEGRIYLSSRGFTPSTTVDAFLKKEIADVETDEIRRIQGVDFVLERDAGDLELVEVPVGRKEKTSQTSGLKSILRGLRFDKVWVADDPEVRDLRFEEVLRVDLSDQSGYVLSTSARADRHFLRIVGFHTVDRVRIGQEEAEEELEEKAELLSRADEIRDFNGFHGSWVYEIGEFTAKKLSSRKRDLMES
jgi:hypothetical protein